MFKFLSVISVDGGAANSVMPVEQCLETGEKDGCKNKILLANVKYIIEYYLLVIVTVLYIRSYSPYN